MSIATWSRLASAVSLAMLAGALLVGCPNVVPPEGRLACESSADCPADWACRADSRCYRTADLDASTLDAGVDGAIADTGIDGSRLDEGVPLPDEGVPPIDEGMSFDMNVGVDAGACMDGTERPCPGGSDEGECRAGTQTCSSLGEWSACVGGRGAMPEICNAADDDCDGAIDEDVPAGMSCTAGMGACMRSGALMCVGGAYASCDAVAGTSSAETCNGVDDDCNGIVDDGVPPGGSCDAGVGACLRTGTFSCVAGTYSVCGAIAGSPVLEICNALDDNCDGTIDNGVPAGPSCSVGVGACIRSGMRLCMGGAYASCSVVAGSPSIETCNSIDDDCDSMIDDGNPGGGAACTNGVGACTRTGVRICSGGTLVCNATPGSPSVEICSNGIDDDCDGIIDDGCSITAISTGGEHTCARRASGAVVCWGHNNFGQLGDSSIIDALTPTSVFGLTDAVEVSAGGSYTCARRASGAVVCWGHNNFGQLGDGTVIDRLVPTPVSGLTDAVELAAAHDQTCARRASGAVVCWGNNAWGGLGDGTTTNRSTPGAVTGLADAAEISAGYDHACARRTSGAVACWGRNLYGQLGDGTTTTRLTPTVVPGLVDAVELSAGGDYTCARRSSSVVCWGYNGNGQLGDGTLVNHSTPMPVSGLTDAVELSCSTQFPHTCVRHSSGTVSCWGYNIYGQLGDGSTTQRLTPTPVVGLTGAVAISTGYYNTCVRRSSGSGSVVCWGYNAEGEIGDGTSGPPRLLLSTPVFGL